MESERDNLFEIAITSSDKFFRNKDYDNAFKELRRASQFINHSIEQFEYLFKLKTINDKYADICIKDNRPDYEMFLIYYLVSFALEILRDLTAFPHLSPFYYRKSKNYSPFTEDDEENDIDLSLKHLKIFKFKKRLMNEFNNFLYNELPILYGIPIKYSGESLSKIMQTDNIEILDELRMFSENLKSKNIDYLPIKMHDFVSTLLKSYSEQKEL